MKSLLHIHVTKIAGKGYSYTLPDPWNKFSFSSVNFFTSICKFHLLITLCLTFRKVHLLKLEPSVVIVFKFILSLLYCFSSMTVKCHEKCLHLETCPFSADSGAGVSFSRCCLISCTTQSSRSS